MRLNKETYRNKVLGCWMGKNAGGTLGAPMEWYRGTNDVTFYQQVLDGNPLPNDDLDIQLLWLIALEERGIDINAHTLGDYWLNYVTPFWAEYGAAKVNMRSGLMPPFSGMVDNIFKDSCGCYIRSEIWACIAPGNPDVAVRYAYEDGIIDHGDGEGVWAEIFCAALESAAFVERDIRTLIDIGLRYIPEDCAVSGAICLAMRLYDEGKGLLESRDEIIRQYNGGYNHGVSPEDVTKGLTGGKVGFDVPDNIGMVILGLLHGQMDFGKSLCYTVNCGEDTDCTAATVGAILGIINGYESIPQKWIDPIGTGIKTACLNLGDLGSYGGKVPADIHDLTERTMKIAEAVLGREGMAFTEEADTPVGQKDASLMPGVHTQRIHSHWGMGHFRFDCFDVFIRYVDGVKISAGKAMRVEIHAINTYHFPERMRVKWYREDGVSIQPEAATAYLLHSRNGGQHVFTFTVSAEQLPGPTLRCCIEMTLDGRATTMMVPIVFLVA